MNKRWVLILVGVLLCSTALVGNIDQVDANPFIPTEGAPSGYRIYSDGTCDVPNIIRNGDTYVFTGDVEGTIVIQKDNIVLDGADHTLQANRIYSGVWMRDRTNVKVQNLIIQNCTYGINLCHAGDSSSEGNKQCTIESCTIRYCENGISFYRTINCSAVGNNLYDNTYGITVSGSGNTFRNNRIDQSKYSFIEEDENIDINDSNTINGKPIYLWISQHNRTVPSNAGLVILKRCSEITVKDLDLTRNGNGLYLYYTSNSIISGNNISDNTLRGITLRWSNNNTITGNQITNPRVNGIEEYESNHNVITHNLISENKVGIHHITAISNEEISSNQIVNNTLGGIWDSPLAFSSNCVATNNYIFGNGGNGLQIGVNAYVYRNNVTLNNGKGIDFGSNSLITENFISKNQIGLYTNGSGSTIKSNTVKENGNKGIFLELEPNNHVYGNNFLNNSNLDTNKQRYYPAYYGTAEAYVREYWVFEGNPLYDKRLGGLAQHIFGPYNSWDNGTVGNYWSDYNHSGLNNGQSAVGSIPYVIAIHNQDNHPLLAPLEFEALQIPTAGLSRQSPQENDSREITFLAVLIAIILSVIAVITGAALYYRRKNRRK